MRAQFTRSQRNRRVDQRLIRGNFGLNVTGYDAREVDDLVRRVAAELDAGHPAGPVIKDAMLRRRIWGRRYDIDAVDWFLGQLLLPTDRAELAGSGADPWADLAVARLDLGGVSGLAEFCAPGEPSRGASQAYFAEQCENAWRDFGQLPGTHLCWGSAGGRKELRMAEQETLVSLRSRLRETFSASGRSFTFEWPSAGKQPGSPNDQPERPCRGRLS